jgi:mono/diheme cytochrome c family protein
MKWLGGFLLVGALAAAGFVYSGWYDISATDQHLAPTYWLLDTSMRRSVKFRAKDIEVPNLDNPTTLRTGAFLYRQHCLQCHGAPGVAPAPFALGLSTFSLMVFENV